MWRRVSHPLAKFGCIINPTDPERQAVIARVKADRTTRRAAQAAVRAERVARHLAEHEERMRSRAETSIRLSVD
jgi:hypothetical protein